MAAWMWLVVLPLCALTGTVGFVVGHVAYARWGWEGWIPASVLVFVGAAVSGAWWGKWTARRYLRAREGS